MIHELLGLVLVFEWLTIDHIAVTFHIVTCVIAKTRVHIAFSVIHQSFTCETRIAGACAVAIVICGIYHVTATIMFAWHIVTCLIGTV